MKPILEIQNISKKFRIQHEKQSYLSLRDSFSSLFHKKSTSSEDFYALKEVSFEVYPGESIGIIGKNGAGKSTLLKILSKITPPTAGKIISRGRIASLLEVGTGFHPELTGRENIFLNGSILGMKHKEIQNKFDEIVDFSGTEKFLDTPLKHYSSGMQLRLAFSVAAFLDPEILIIDEVLAVGDAEFQKKCMGKMENVSKSGRTILFVSHNLGAVETLCPNSIILDKGNLKVMGNTTKLIKDYINQFAEDDNSMINGTVYLNNSLIKSVQLLCDSQPSNNLYMGCDMELEVTIESDRKIEYPVLGLVIRDFQNNAILGVNNKHYSSIKPMGFYNGKFKISIPNLPLMSGKYFLDLHVGDGLTDIEIYTNACTLNIESKDFTGTGYIPNEKLNKLFIKNITWDITGN
ncbi:MAG: ABC transporter ATP-binding protein [Bacteroidia bacterium]